MNPEKADPGFPLTGGAKPKGEHQPIILSS